MATDSDPRPFDVATVERLIALMGAHDLIEVVLKEAGQTIRLRRGGVAPQVAYAPAAQMAPAPQVAPASPGAPAPVPEKKYLEVKSEMVGTVYLKPHPEKPEYVRVGGAISAETTVCTIEAMKIFNEIKAGVAGTVAEVCVANGDGVQYGTVLFKIDPGV